MADGSSEWLCLGESADGRRWGWLELRGGAEPSTERSLAVDRLAALPPTMPIEIARRTMAFWRAWRLAGRAGVELGSRVLVLGSGQLAFDVLRICGLCGCQWRAVSPADPRAEAELAIPERESLAGATDRGLLPAAPDVVVITDSADRLIGAATRLCRTNGTIVVAGLDVPPFDFGFYPDVHRRGLRLLFAGPDVGRAGSGGEPFEFERLSGALIRAGVVKA